MDKESYAEVVPSKASRPVTSLEPRRAPLANNATFCNSFKKHVKKSQLRFKVMKIVCRKRKTQTDFDGNEKQTGLEKSESKRQKEA